MAVRPETLLARRASDGGSVIAVTILAQGAKAAIEQALAHTKFASAVELRIDGWETITESNVRSALQELQKHFETVILTLRMKADGGLYDGTRSDRNQHLHECVQKLPAQIYVDVEIEQLGDQDDAALVQCVQKCGGKIIRSAHVFEPGMDVAVFERMRLVPADEIPKLAVMPASTGDLLQLLQFARGYRFGRQIILGMGEWGIPSRICPSVFGSLWTYASNGKKAAAPGQICPEEMVRRFRTDMHGPDTRYFAIFGNPVMHSRSPDFHNQRFEQEGQNAAYLIFPLSSAAEGHDVIQQWPLEGVSVTIPYKNDILKWPGVVVEDSAAAVGAANTAVRDYLLAHSGQNLRLLNTDVGGFLHALREKDFPFSQARCLVIGAGGAARAVVYGLLAEGAAVTIVNRTLSRAQALCTDMQKMVEGAEVEAYELPASKEAAHIILQNMTKDEGGYPELVVQTTQIGMEPDIDKDPLPAWEFTGNELVYDIIYTPECTRFLQRASAVGCQVISGKAMFQGQADLQSQRFLAALAGKQKS